MPLGSSNPVLFAHRGASKYAPENTLAAFELAVNQNADAIELDTKLTVDHKVIVIHDQTVDRTTDGSGKVTTFELAAIKELDAGGYFNPSYRGEKIPTLDEVLEAIGTKAFINIELANYASPFDPLPQITAEIVTRHDLAGTVLFSSFNPIALHKAKRALPRVPIGLLAAPGLSGIWARSQFGRLIPYDALHPEVCDTNQTLIQKAHRNGFRVHTYTVNDFERMKQLFSWQIDGIFTDDIPLARKALAYQIEKGS
jgi:glycerophosphoryl diester phosphodiesterase